MNKIAPGSIFSLIILIVACNKDLNQGEAPVSLTGNWNWAASYYDAPLSDSNPRTPAYTGKTMTIRFDENKHWKQTETGLAADSGTYSLGHGIYSPASGNAFHYDSVVFYKNGQKISWTAYLVLSGDTLAYAPYAQGLVGGGTTIWVKAPTGQ